MPRRYEERRETVRFICAERLVETDPSRVEARRHATHFLRSQVLHEALAHMDERADYRVRIESSERSSSFPGAQIMEFRLTLGKITRLPSNDPSEPPPDDD